MTYDEWLKSREGQRRNGEALDGSGRIWRRDGQETAAHKKAREEKEEDMAQSNAMSYDDYLKARGRKRTLIQPKDETSYDDIHKRSPTVMASFESRYEADFDGRLASSKSARAEAEEEATKLLKYINDNESTIPKADREEYKRAIGEVLRAYKDIDSRLKGDKAYWNLFDNEASWGAYTDRQKSAIESQKRLMDYSRNITSAEDRMMQASSAQKEADRIRETNDRIRYQLERTNMSADMRKKWEDQIARNEEEIKNLEATANEYKLDSRVKESIAHATARDFTEDEKDLLDYRAPQENNGLEIIGRTIETGVSQLVGAGPHIVRIVSDEIGRFKAYNSSYAEGQNYDPKDLEKVDTLTWAIRKIDDRLTKEAGWANEKRETALRGHNGFTRFLSDAGVSAIVMLGDMAFANAVGAGANAMPKMLSSATKGYQAIKNMAESPYLYLTFARETGAKYDEEIARGADTTTAAINAMTTGLINAAIELGFGIEGGAGVQSLPDEVRQKLLGADKMTAKEILTDWLMDALDEGKEEIAQKFVGDFITQLTEDPRGVINLYGSEDIPEILESGAAGVFLGGVVGGVNVASDAFFHTDTGSDLYNRIMFAGTNIGSRRAERMGYTQDMLDAQIESGMQAPEGSTARAITEKIAAKRRVSVNDLRMLSKTNQQQIAEEEAEAIGKELEEEDEVTVARAKQIVRQAVLGEEISPEDTEFALSNQAVREAVNGYADVERDAFERKRLVTQEATQAASWRQEQNTDKSRETSRDYSLFRNDAFELAEAYAEEETDRGETTRKTTGETIEIERIASTGKDMTIRLKSGETVKTGDIGFSSAGEAYLYETFGRNESYTPNTATQFVRAYDGGNPAAYAAAMNYTYKVGRIGIPQGEIAGSEAAKILSPEQINMAYKLGAAARSTENASVRRKSAAGVSYDRSVDRAALNEGQKTQIRVTEEIAKVGGLAVRFYTSRVENGKRVYTDAGGKTVAAPNGYFISGTNEIMIDTEAGTNGEGKILFTLAHELTHFIKENNAKGFNALAEFLTKEYGGAGKSVSEMVSMQKAKARRAGRSISTEEAFEEFVADSMETMLADGTAAEKIAQLRKTDKSLADKIVEFFEKIKEALKGIMAKFTPDSEEGRFVKSLGDKVDELRNIFAEGAAGAAKRFEAAEIQPMTAGEEISTSLRRDGELGQNAVSVNEKNGFVAPEVMNAALETREAIQDFMTKNKKALALPEDKEGDVLFGNQSYGRSAENSSICIRSLVQDGVVSYLEKRVGRPLTINEQLFVSQFIGNFTDTPPCAYCYVAADRMAFNEQLGKFFDERDIIFDSAAKGLTIDETLQRIKGNRTMPKKPTAKDWTGRARYWYNEAKSGNVEGRLAQEDVAGLLYADEDIAAMRKKLTTDTQRKEYDMAVAFAHSASHAKKRVYYTAYNGNILNISQSLVNSLNEEFGLRMYSYSDFSPAFILENMQMVTDASVRGLKMLAYTKEPDFVKIFAPTGMNINISVNAYEQNGMIAEDAMQGMAWEEAKALRKKYPNVGITMVVTSDAMVEEVMKNEGGKYDWVDVILPYHSVFSGGGAVARYFGYEDFKAIQADGKMKLTDENGKAIRNRNKEVFPPEHQNDLIKYVKALERKHLTPRFAKYLKGYDEYRAGTITDAEFRQMNPSYMKLVNEVRRSAESTPVVQPVFDKDAAMESLNGLIKRGGYNAPLGKDISIQNEIADDIIDEIKSGRANEPRPNIRYSIRDSEGKEIIITEAEIERAKREIAEMEPIIALKGNPFAKNTEKDFKTMGTEYFNSIGGMAHNQIIGDVILDETGIKHLISYISKRKASILPAIQPVIEKGKILLIEDDHKGYGFGSILLGATITLDNTPYYMGVAVRQDEGTNKYYIHDAITVEKNNRASTPTKHRIGDEHRTASGENPTIASILSSIAKYNPKYEINFSNQSISENGRSGDAKPSLRNPTDAELIFNAEGETVGEREQIAAFKKTSLAYENAARSEAILRVKVRQKKATQAELAEARRRTAKLKDSMEEERKALSPIVARELEKMAAADAEIGERIARGMESIRTQDQLDLLADIQRLYEGELAKADADAEAAFEKGRLAGYDEAVATIGDTLEKGQNAVERIRAAETRTAKAEKARKDLVKLAAAWKRDIKDSRVAMPSVSDINAVARSIKQEAFSTMKTEDIRAALTEMASMIAEADTKPIKIDELFVKAKKLASELVTNAVEVRDTQKIEREKLRSYLKENQVSVNDNENDLDPAFRKRNSWWLTKSGSGIDTVYRELQEMFGETRFPDAVNPADMALNVEKAIDSMSPQAENPWIGTEIQEKELLANRVVESMISGEIGFSYVSAKKLAGELDALKKQYAASKEAFETEAAENAKNAAAVKTLQRKLERVRDRDRKAYNEAKDEIRTQAAEIRKLKTSAKKDTRRIEAYQDRLKQKTVDKNEAVKEAKKKTKELTLTKERERVSKNELRNKIRKIAHDLQRQTENATKNKYIPAELKKAVLEAVDLIEPTSWKNLPETATMEDQMNRIHRLFADLRDNQALQLAYDASIDRKIADCATMISETTIRKLSVEQLTEIHETLSAVVKMVSDAQKIIGTTIEKDALEVSRTMRQETASIKRTQDNIGAKWIMTSISPEAVFNRFGNYVKNSYWHRMWQMLDDGQTAETQILMEAAEQFRDLMNDKKAGRLRETVDIGLKDDNGKAILISRDMMMSVYMDLINEDNARHVKGGGYIVPNIKQYYGRDEENGFGTKAMRAKGLAEELDKAGMTGDSEAYNSVKNAMNAYGNGLGMEIEKQLNDPELGSYMREWISKAQYFFDVWSKNHINATTMEYYGFEKAHVLHYFPIRTSANYRATAFESIQMDNALESMGIMKDRVQSSSPILLEGLSDVIAAHARKVAQYSGLLIPTKNFEKVYGKTEYAFANSLKEQLNKKFGSSANDYISKLMGDLTGTNRRKTSMVDQLRGLQAQGVLTGSLRVTLAQAASFPTAAAEVGWGPIAKALAKGGKNNRLISRADSELIAKYSPLLWSRMKGYAELNLGDLKNGYVKKEIITKARWLAGWIQAVDGATVGRLWSAAEYYVQEKQPDLEVKSDDYYKEVAKVFNRIIERTQPDYDVLERPQILRGGSVKEMQGLIKQLTMFMTQRLQNNTLLIDGIDNYRRINEQYQAHQNDVTIEDVQEARKKLAEVITSRLVSNSIITVMKLLADAVLHNMNAYRDDDENLTLESVLKQLGYSFIETEISNFLWGSEIFSVISALIGKKRYYAIEFGAVSEAASVAEEFVKAADAITSGDTEKIKKAWWRFGKDISVLLGIPVSNVEKIWNAFVYHIEDIKNGDFGSFEAGVERNTSQIKDNLFAAYQYGDKEAIRKWENALAEKGKDDKTGRELVDKTRKEYIKDSDPRANEAMIAYVTGDLRTYARLVDEIISDGYWTLTNVTKAIKDSDGLFAMKDVAKSLQGDDTEMTMEIIRYLRAEGRDDKQIKSAITSYWKPKYIESSAKERVIIQRKLWNTGLYGTTSEDKEAFQKAINKWLG